MVYGPHTAAHRRTSDVRPKSTIRTAAEGASVTLGFSVAICPMEDIAMRLFEMIIVTLLVSTGSAQAACTDSAAVASTRAAADLQCPCASAGSHKAYVKCIAHAAKTAARSGSLPFTSPSA